MSLRATGQQVEVLAPGAGVLRSTGQQVEILAPGNGKLRATVQQVECLCEYNQPIINKNVVSTLTFTEVIAVDINGVNAVIDTLTFVQDFEISVNSYEIIDTLTFVENIIVSEIIEQELVQTLTFTQNLIAKSNSYIIADVLSFNDIIDVNRLGINRDQYDEIEFSQIIVGTIVNLAGYLHDTLSFVQTITIQGLEYVVISDILNFTQTIDWVAPYNIIVEMLMNWAYNNEGHPIWLKDSSFEESIVLERDATRYDNNNLSLSQTISAVLEKDAAISEVVTDTLTFIDIVSDTSNPDPDTITFSEIIKVDLCTPVTSNLSLSQTVITEFSSSHAITDTLLFVSQFNYTVTTTDITKVYHPFIGETNDPTAPTTIPTTKETYTEYDCVVLYYPTYRPTYSITIDGLELGDIDRSEKSRINRETRGGTLIIFSDPSWPQSRKLILTFSGLSESEGEDILELINNSLGDLVALRDWYGRLWCGIITNPNEPLVYNGTCNLSLQLELDCVRLWDEDVEDTLTIIDSPVSSMVRSLEVTDTLTSVDDFEITNFLNDELTFVEEIIETLN